MSKRFNWQIGLGTGLFMLSVFVYFCHYLIFRDAHHIFIYLLGDIAFVFIEVLLVTLVLHRLLSYQEKRQKLKKLNMVIGAFFSDVGQQLLKNILPFDQESAALGKQMGFSGQSADQDFLSALSFLAGYAGTLDLGAGDLSEMKVFLQKKKGFLLNLLSSANLLEHEAFSDLLWSIFHLTEELYYRQDLNALPEADRQHLLLDLQRVYRCLIREWLCYVRHLKSDYPYLFSLAVRTNPFLPQQSVTIQK